jgi:transcriptional regulator with PAS, ATPase and Fis domain
MLINIGKPKKNRYMRTPFSFNNIIGKSAGMQTVYRKIMKTATSHANVIIYGESGTGKELVAHAIHNISSRKSKQFVAVNCGGIAESLAESQFFGHSRGAFTGATENKAGFLDLSHEGTLFLDELGEISLNMQVKLLRVLDGYGYRAVGENKLRKPNIRIVAATNKNLKKMVEQGTIREDFYYRVHILPILLPPLRERKEDIPLLVRYVMEKDFHGQEIPYVPPEVLEALMQHEWPGNVRELQNVIRRYLAFGKLDIPSPVSATVAPSLTLLPPQSTGESLAEKMAGIERGIILDCLERNQWHRSKVAKELAINIKTLYRKMVAFGLN